jgi:hypothetical protein
MSKKVVRLTESQLRLMINKVIKEQTAPTNNQPSPSDNKKRYFPAPLKMTKNDFIVKEILENISKNIFIFVSKLNPTQIIRVQRNGFQPREYNFDSERMNFDNKYQADTYKRSTFDVKSYLYFTVYYVLDGTVQRGDRSFNVELYENTIESTLQKLNKNEGVIHKFEVFNDATDNITSTGRLYHELYYIMGKNAKATYDLLSRAQPNILTPLRSSLMTYARDEKTKVGQDMVYAMIRELDSVTGQQQPQPQQQQQQPQQQQPQQQQK